MAMLKDEFLNTLTSIGTCEDEAQRRTLLASLHDEATELYDSNADLESQRSKLEDDNEKLRSANMDLFLRIGKKKDPDDQDDLDDPDKKRSFDDLFDEKGGLK